jgi:hypothetical protein
MFFLGTLVEVIAFFIEKKESDEPHVKIPARMRNSPPSPPMRHIKKIQPPKLISFIFHPSPI